MKAYDLTNKKFGRLLVVAKSHRKANKVMWECLCDCGKTTFVSTYYLTSGLVSSCGCLKVDRLIKRNTTHNQRHTKLYEVWKTMRQRCYNPNNFAYKNYGARGISVCDDWQHFEPFYQWSLANGYMENLTIDRIDVNGNYEPSNCRWVSHQIQANNMRCNRLIEYNGETDTLANWARRFGLVYSSLYNRINNGWSIEKALTTPSKKH